MTNDNDTTKTAQPSDQFQLCADFDSERTRLCSAHGVLTSAFAKDNGTFTRAAYELFLTFNKAKMAEEPNTPNEHAEYVALSEMVQVRMCVPLTDTCPEMDLLPEAPEKIIADLFDKATPAEQARIGLLFITGNGWQEYAPNYVLSHDNRLFLASIRARFTKGEHFDALLRAFIANRMTGNGDVLWKWLNAYTGETLPTSEDVIRQLPDDALRLRLLCKLPRTPEIRADLIKAVLNGGQIAAMALDALLP